MGKFSDCLRNYNGARGTYNSYFVTYTCKCYPDIFPQVRATVGEEELPASASAGAGCSVGLIRPPSVRIANQ